MKSSNHENVALAQAKGVWSTPPQNEARLNQAFQVVITKLIAMKHIKKHCEKVVYFADQFFTFCVW